MVRAAEFTLIAGQLYKMGPDEILRRCVLEHEKLLILAEAHSGAAGGHYTGKATAQKILTAGLWWPTIHKDAREYCHSCDICQRTGKPSRRDEMPLVPQVTLQAFDKWAIDFVGPINPLQRNLEQDTLLQQLITLLVGPNLNQSRTVALLQLRSSYLIIFCQGLDVLEFL